MSYLNKEYSAQKKRELETIIIKLYIFISFSDIWLSLKINLWIFKRRDESPKEDNHYGDDWLFNQTSVRMTFNLTVNIYLEIEVNLSQCHQLWRGQVVTDWGFQEANLIKYKLWPLIRKNHVFY